MKLVMTKMGTSPLAIIENEALNLGALDELKEFQLRSITHLLSRGEEVITTVDAAIKRVQNGADTDYERLRESKVLTPLTSVDLSAPFPKPGLLFFTGGNYKAHLDEISKKTGMTIKPPEFPIGFIKNSNAVVGPGDNIVLPETFPDMIDFEVEFSFVVGKRCHNVSEKEANDYIAGYTIINDVCARDWNESAKRDDGSMDLTMPTFGKQFPTFCPMGPAFVSRDEIDDPYDVEVMLKLNGDVMQNSRTDDLLFGFEKILSYFSQFFVFQPGDVITTGSPPGVGFARNPPLFLRPGDIVEISAAGVGAMSNTVVSA